ncbi:hypothetical protein LUZ62_058651 [Rhynchospora pubera]|uniref:Dof zinc finger protein n=1 Tax=Rhynchospora pubera TaxID=906938 RepID=A0AAV8E2A7_9POAL|nr:hypothetical protein LUZ62_058651 [Rhynchospora pubera]
MGVSSLQASVNGLDNFSQFGCTTNSSFRIMEIPKPTRNPQQHQQQPWPPLRCPRCNSTNTKFCYYNNYSKTQPRYLCKACRRHWTDGGTLRDVPVGGGRKNKRNKVATTNATSPASANASNSSVVINNTNKSVVQLVLNGSPSSNVLPEILREVLLQPAQQMFSLPLQPPPTLSPDFGMMSSLMGPREIISNNLGSYTNGLSNSFSTYGYGQMGTGGNISMAPPMQLGTGNWSSLDNDFSGLANPDVKPPTSEGF